MTATPNRAKLDDRLLNARHSLTVTDLVRLWADHTPPTRTACSQCRTCGHHYTDTAPLCPTAAVVRPLLRRRRREAPTSVLEALTTNQLDDLLGNRLSTSLPRREGHR